MRRSVNTYVHLLSIISVSALLYHMYPWCPTSRFHSMNQVWTSTNVFYRVTRCFSHKQMCFSSSVTVTPLFGIFLPLFLTRQTYIFFKGTWHTLKSSKSLHSLDKHLSLMRSVSVTKLNFIVHAFRVVCIAIVEWQKVTVGQQREQNLEHNAGTNCICTG